MPTSDFARYRHTQLAELRPYVPGEDMTDIYVTPEDADAGSPKDGDMIQRNPIDHMDQMRLLAAQDFRNNYERA
jgi:hypothetical protein